MALEVEDVAGRDDGGSPDVRACGYFVLLKVAAAVESGGAAVVPAPVEPNTDVVAS
jgi:hypothetical protein